MNFIEKIINNSVDKVVTQKAQQWSLGFFSPELETLKNTIERLETSVKELTAPKPLRTDKPNFPFIKTAKHMVWEILKEQKKTMTARQIAFHLQKTDRFKGKSISAMHSYTCATLNGLYKAKSVEKINKKGKVILWRAITDKDGKEG